MEVMICSSLFTHCFSHFCVPIDLHLLYLNGCLAPGAFPDPAAERGLPGQLQPRALPLCAVVSRFAHHTRPKHRHHSVGFV